MSEHMLSTKDNPFNPYIQFDYWYAWDTAMGYHSLSYLARLVRTSDELPEALQRQATEDAIDDIVADNFNGMYIKVAKPEEPQ